MRNAMSPAAPMPPRPAKMVKDAKSAQEQSRTMMFKSGGSASKRADGCAVRGKTRGKML